LRQIDRRDANLSDINIEQHPNPENRHGHKRVRDLSRGRRRRRSRRRSPYVVVEIPLPQAHESGAQHQERPPASSLDDRHRPTTAVDQSPVESDRDRPHIGRPPQAPPSGENEDAQARRGRRRRRTRRQKITFSLHNFEKEFERHPEEAGPSFLTHPTPLDQGEFDGFGQGTTGGGLAQPIPVLYRRFIDSAVVRSDRRWDLATPKKPPRPGLDIDLGEMPPIALSGMARMTAISRFEARRDLSPMRKAADRLRPDVRFI
jgi:hypothetical protein